MEILVLCLVSTRAAEHRSAEPEAAHLRCPSPACALAQVAGCLGSAGAAPAAGMPAAAPAQCAGRRRPWAAPAALQAWPAPAGKRGSDRRSSTCMSVKAAYVKAARTTAHKKPGFEHKDLQQTASGCLGTCSMLCLPHVRLHTRC
jgi:hypothetical protein